MYKLDCLGWDSIGCCIIIPHNDNYTISILDIGIKLPSYFTLDFVKSHKIVYYHTHNHADHFLQSNYDLIKQAKEFEEHYEDGLKVSHYSAKLDNDEGAFAHSFEIDGKKIFLLTDVGGVTDWVMNGSIDLSSYDLLLIECNWDYAYVNGLPNSFRKIQTISKKRHLSNLECYKFIIDSHFNTAGNIIFLHKSTEHTTENTFTMFNSLSQKWIIAERNITVIYSDSYFQAIPLIEII